MLPGSTEFSFHNPICSWELLFFVTTFSLSSTVFICVHLWFHRIYPTDAR
jgi:hypothetical protein